MKERNGNEKNRLQTQVCRHVLLVGAQCRVAARSMWELFLAWWQPTSDPNQGGLQSYYAS